MRSIGSRTSFTEERSHHAATKPASQGGKTARKRGHGEPAAIARLNKSLDAAQDALAVLRNDVRART